MAIVDFFRGGKGSTHILHNLCERAEVARPEIFFNLKRVSGPRGGLDEWEGTTVFQDQTFRAGGRDKKSAKSLLAVQILAAAGKGLLAHLLPNKKTKRGTRSKEAVERKKMKFLSSQKNIVVKTCSSCGYPNYVKYNTCGKCNSSLEMSTSSVKAERESSEEKERRSPGRSEDKREGEYEERVELWKMERHDEHEKGKNFGYKQGSSYGFKRERSLEYKQESCNGLKRERSLEYKQGICYGFKREKSLEYTQESSFGFKRERILEYKQESCNRFEREGSEEYKSESSYRGTRGIKRERNMRREEEGKCKTNQEYPERTSPRRESVKSYVLEQETPAYMASISSKPVFTTSQQKSVSEELERLHRRKASDVINISNKLSHLTRKQMRD